MVKEYIPQRGDIIWLDFNPQAGHEQAGKRPALVLSPEAYNRKTGLLLACPITSRVKGYPFEVLIMDELPVKGAILADQIKSLDWQARNARFACQVSEPILEDVVEKIELLLEPHY